MRKSSAPRVWRPTGCRVNILVVTIDHEKEGTRFPEIFTAKKHSKSASCTRCLYIRRTLVREWHDKTLPSRPPSRNLLRAVPAVLPIIFLVLSITLSTTTISQLPVKTAQATPSSTPPFKYVVTIVEENQPAVADIGLVGNPTDAPYLNNILIPNGALAMNYHSTSHNGSLAQYIGMISGNSRCYDNSPDPNAGNPCRISGDTIVDRVEASGRTWKAFMEDYKDCSTVLNQTGCNPSGCFMYLYWDGGGGQYLANHNPFLYFPQIATSKDRCLNILSANSVRVGYTKFGTVPDVFLNYLNSSSPANYVFMVPNHCDSFHGPFGPPVNNGTGWQCESYNSGPSFICPGMNTNNSTCLHAQVKAGDTYLQQVVPKILSSKMFQTGDAALFITFDEANSHPSRDPVCSNPDSSTPSYGEPCPILGLWVGGNNGPVKIGYQSKTMYTHYSYLKTIESAWQLVPFTTNDSTTSAMGEFFTRPFPPPMVSFSFTPQYPVTGDKVTFVVDSVSAAATPYTYDWTFGDGVGTATGSPAVYSYWTAGTFAVKLKVTDSQGQSGVSSLTVEVTNPLISSFTYSPSSLGIGSIVSFASQALGGKSPYSYKWDFGDGAKDTVANPNHTYVAGGSYTVSLSVTDSQQHVSSSTGKLIVTVMSGSFTIDPRPAQVGGTVTFTASASGGTPPYNYYWNFGDGTTGTQQLVSHSYYSDATFTVTLNITDSASQFRTILNQVIVGPAPIDGSIFMSPQTPTAGDQIRFTAQTTGGSAPYTYKWDFGDLSTSTGSSANHSYSTDGIFTIRLNVTDGSNRVQTKMITRNVAILGALCAIGASCKILLSSNSLTTGQATTFTATAEGGVGPYTFQWDFSDGGTSIGSTVDHAYTRTGAFTVSLVVKDSAGHSYATSSTVNVKSALQHFSVPIMAMSFASGAALSGVAYTFRGRILRRFRD